MEIIVEELLILVILTRIQAFFINKKSQIIIID